MIKVMIVDDQGLLRKSIGQIINTDDNIEVVDMVGTGKEAVDSCGENKPDVILMDIEMPEMNGIIATRIIKEKYDDVKVIILTTFENTDNILDAFSVESDGYIVKDLGCEELISTIKCVYYGFTVIHESVRKIMLQKIKQIGNSKSTYLDIINKEEVDIIRLIVMGKSNKNIAAILSYTEGTIKNKVSKIYGKLQIEDRVQLALFATQNGIV